MPVKHDTRVITHATPPLVTVRKPKSGNADLRLHMAMQRCEYHSHGNPAGCSDRGRVIATRSLPATVKSPMRVQRLCLEHLANPPMPEPTIDEILASISEISKLLYNPRDMSTWDYKWDGGS